MGKDVPSSSLTLLFILTQPFYMLIPPHAQTPLDFGSLRLFFSHVPTPSLSSPHNTSICSSCSRPFYLHAPPLSQKDMAQACPWEGRDDEPQLPLSGLVLLPEVGDCTGTTTETSAVCGGTRCSPFPHHTFYAGFKLASLSPTNAVEKTCTK